MFNRFIHWGDSEVKKVLSFQLHWGFAVFFLQRDFPGPVIWTLWPVGFSPHYEQIWGLTLCVLWSRDNTLLCTSSPRTVVIDVRNVNHLAVSSSQPGRPDHSSCPCLPPTWVSRVRTDPPSCDCILERFVREHSESWQSHLNWSELVSDNSLCCWMTGPYTHWWEDKLAQLPWKAIWQKPSKP